MMGNRTATAKVRVKWTVLYLVVHGDFVDFTLCAHTCVVEKIEKKGLLIKQERGCTFRKCSGMKFKQTNYKMVP